MRIQTCLTLDQVTRFILLLEYYSSFYTWCMG